MTSSIAATFDYQTNAAILGPFTDVGLSVGALERRVTGRVVITNYDPRTRSDAERQALNTRAGANPGSFVLVNIRPGHPGGDLPLFGALKLRSLNRILSFVAADHGASREYDVTKDPRTGDSGPNPRRALGIEVADQAPAGLTPYVRYANRYYSIADTPWDRQAFNLLPLLCVPLAVTECGPDDGCQRGMAASVNLLHFLRVDVNAMTIRAVEEGRESPIGSLARVNGKLILQGVQGARGWTLMIAEETGQMSATISGAAEGYIIFGTCTQLSEGGVRAQ